MTQSFQDRPTSTAKLVLATGNSHKLQEVRQILGEIIPNFEPGWLGSAADYNYVEPVEDGATFVENSLIKAHALAEVSNLPTIADDSGLCVQIMGGAPGIFSARWAGKHGDDKANRELLLAQLKDVPKRLRDAYFACAASLVLPDGTEFSVLEKMPGRIATQASGQSGFGYDPIFIPLGYERTNAQLSAAEKNAISHRGKAFKELSAPIRELL